MIRAVVEFPVRGVERLFTPAGLPLVEKQADGLPSTSILVAGAAGTGKTTLATALAVGIARMREGVVLYVTTESVPTELLHKARLLGLTEAAVKGWDGRGSAAVGDIVVQHLAVVTSPSEAPNTMDDAIDAVWKLVTEKRTDEPPIAVVVIDAFGLLASEGEGEARRRAVVGFVQALEGKGITSVLIQETLDASRTWLSFVVDLVFELQFERDPEGGPKTRRLSCPKSRYGTALVGPHDYGLDGQRPVVWPDFLRATEHETPVPALPIFLPSEQEGTFFVVSTGAVVVSQSAGKHGQRLSRAIDLSEGGQTITVFLGPLARVLAPNNKAEVPMDYGPDAVAWTVFPCLRGDIPNLVRVTRVAAVRGARNRAGLPRVVEALRRLGVVVWIDDADSDCADLVALADLHMQDERLFWWSSVTRPARKREYRCAAIRFAAAAQGEPPKGAAPAGARSAEILRSIAEARTALDRGETPDTGAMERLLTDVSAPDTTVLRCALAVTLDRAGIPAGAALSSLPPVPSTDPAEARLFAQTLFDLGEDWRAARAVMLASEVADWMRPLWSDLLAIYARPDPTGAIGDGRGRWARVRALAATGDTKRVKHAVRVFANEVAAPDWLRFRLQSEASLEARTEDGFIEARRLLSEGLAASTVPPVERADMLHNLGVAELGLSNVADASAHFRKALELNPHLVLARDR